MVEQSPDRVLPAQPAGVPGHDREFELLQEMARAVLDAATALAAALEGERPFDDAWGEIRDLEHKADAIARDLFDALLPS
ncbi:MAG: hypothetical protein QN125_00005, partial [Armatimonadota bacterium]|nr:hypothetical protein [Armatimonadota bacterium]